MSSELEKSLMEEYAEETGLSSDEPSRRYLWTDAFAVCNYLGLHRRIGGDRNLDLALELVDQVHQVLGKHRPDDSRKGWISGLSEEEGERHPTRGGLRIGKELSERGPEEPVDSRLEWERDGQYFHYLTKWMHALHRVALETGDSTYYRWAVELAEAAHAGFTRTDPASGRTRMVWKMSIELDRPLVPSMGHHDPLDGLITFLDLETSPMARGEESEVGLREEIAVLESLCQGTSWVTRDPLGVGGLLLDAFRLGAMVETRGLHRDDLLCQLLKEGRSSLEAFSRSDSLDAPAGRRLAFRELGLSIGLHGVERLEKLIGGRETFSEPLEDLDPFLGLASRIEVFWTESSHRHTRSWTSHREINQVMLATSLAPGGFLRMEP